jgi:hypothetical protein
LVNPLSRKAPTCAKLPGPPNPEGTGGSENAGELILYSTQDGRAQIQMRAVDGTVWLTQAQMAELFDTSVQNANQRIQAVLADGELTEATINSELIVRQEGARLVRREVQMYNLDMVLAVGYRVRSPRGIQFRQWATTILHEYLVKGWLPRIFPGQTVSPTSGETVGWHRLRHVAQNAPGSDLPVLATRTTASGRPDRLQKVRAVAEKRPEQYQAIPAAPLGRSRGSAARASDGSADHSLVGQPDLGGLAQKDGKTCRPGPYELEPAAVHRRQ